MIGQRIKEIRNNNNLTQEELADGIISRTYLSLIEKGSVHPSTNVLIKLSKRLNCSINDFMTEVSQFKYNDVEVLREIAYYEQKVKNNDLDYLEQFLSKEYEKLENIPVVDCGRIYLIYAKYYNATGNTEKVSRCIDEALKRLGSLSYNHAYIDAVEIKTEILILKKRYLEALDQLEEVFDILVKLNDMDIEVIRLLHNISKCYYLIEENITARRLIERLEKHSEALHIDYRRIDRLTLKVKVLTQLKEYSAVLETAETVNSPMINLFCCYSYYKKGRIKESVVAFRNLENKIDALDHDDLSLKVSKELRNKLDDFGEH